MQSVSAQPYSKRPVPSPGKALSAWAEKLVAYLGSEFGNVQRGMSRATSQTITTSVTATVNDGLILVSTTAGNVTVTLPSPSTVADMVVTIKRITAGANTLTIAGTVDGVVNPTLATQWSAKTVWAHIPVGGTAGWFTVATV